MTCEEVEGVAEITNGIALSEFDVVPYGTTLCEPALSIGELVGSQAASASLYY